MGKIACGSFIYVVEYSSKSVYGVVVWNRRQSVIKSMSVRWRGTFVVYLVASEYI